MARRSQSLKAKAEGYCPVCCNSARKIKAGDASCTRCRRIRNAAYKKLKESRRLRRLCYSCGIKPRARYRKVCEDCASLEGSKKSTDSCSPSLRRLEILMVLGPICVRCGFADIRALQIDHKKGGGSKHRRENSWSKVYKYMLDNLDKFQVLCANCNCIKRHESSEG